MNNGASLPASLLASILCGMFIGAPERFEVAGVRRSDGCQNLHGAPRLGIRSSPGRLTIICQTVDFLIRQAYLADGRDPLLAPPNRFNQAIKDAPSWISSERYTIEAAGDHTAGRETMLGGMLQALLEERFRLKTHWEIRKANVYRLVIGKNGPVLRPAADGRCVAFDPESAGPPSDSHLCGVLVRSVKPSVPSALYGATMQDFCRALSRLLGRDVFDQTGINGKFDIALELSSTDLFPMRRQLASGPENSAGESDPDGSSIFAAVRKLGLALISAKGPVETLVIDHIERPSDN